jgi:hypothetical protein
MVPALNIPERQRGRVAQRSIPTYVRAEKKSPACGLCSLGGFLQPSCPSGPDGLKFLIFLFWFFPQVGSLGFGGSDGGDDGAALQIWVDHLYIYMRSILQHCCPLVVIAPFLLNFQVRVEGYRTWSSVFLDAITSQSKVSLAKPLVYWLLKSMLSTQAVLCCHDLFSRKKIHWIKGFKTMYDST